MTPEECILLAELDRVTAESDASGFFEGLLDAPTKVTFEAAMAERDAALAQVKLLRAELEPKP